MHERGAGQVFAATRYYVISGTHLIRELVRTRVRNWCDSMRVSCPFGESAIAEQRRWLHGEREDVREKRRGHTPWQPPMRFYTLRISRANDDAKREKKREKEKKHQTLSRVQHDVRRGCRLRTTMIEERNDGYTRAAPPTLNDVIPPAATWSPLTYARQYDTNITTRLRWLRHPPCSGPLASSHSSVVHRLTSKR